ncbi:MAG: TIGR04084 family radical SAM/SPASM domain-containing protein [archaeon]
MQFYITLTTDCNMRCSYCYGKCSDDFGSDFSGLQIDYEVPSRIVYDIETLRSFCMSDQDLTLIFYGGEPLLETEILKKIMDTIPADRYMIQTNGLLLDSVEPRYANKFHTILVSVDGDEKTTDKLRGNGTYRRVVENVKRLRQNGFEGEIIARMTVEKATDIRGQVNWLLSNSECPFDSVHWQLDAMFWQNDYDAPSFKKWMKESYTPSVNLLISDWVGHMQEYGEVQRIYPLIGVTQTLLSGQHEKLRCGAGWTTFNIQTNGIITPCPVMAGLRDFYLGDIERTSAENLVNAVFPDEPCKNCNIGGLCGGRCLYANVTKLWGDEGFAMVCETVRNLVASLEGVLPVIKHLVNVGTIAFEDFNYPRLNSCEIIP